MAPVTSRVPAIAVSAPTFKFFSIPTPPSTISAPVSLSLDWVVLFKFVAPVTSRVPSNVTAWSTFNVPRTVVISPGFEILTALAVFVPKTKAPADIVSISPWIVTLPPNCEVLLVATVRLSLSVVAPVTSRVPVASILLALKLASCAPSKTVGCMSTSLISSCILITNFGGSETSRPKKALDVVTEFPLFLLKSISSPLSWPPNLLWRASVVVVL